MAFVSAWYLRNKQLNTKKTVVFPFKVSSYTKEIEEMKHVTKQEFIASLRRSANPTLPSSLILYFLFKFVIRSSEISL